MKTSTTGSTSYEIVDPIERKFFRSSTFSERLEEYFQNVYSLKISIIQNNFSNNGSQCCKIQINETSKKEQLVDIMNKIFEKMQSKTFTDDNVKAWFRYPSPKIENLEYLQTLINNNDHQLFVVCEESDKLGLKIYYLAEDLTIVPTSEGLDKIIHEKVSQEVIVLPFQYEKFEEINDEIGSLRRNTDISFSSVTIDRTSNPIKKKIILFGYSEIVNQLKKDLLDLFKKYCVSTFKLHSIDTQQIDFLLEYCHESLRQIEINNKPYDVELRLRSKEFSAPLHLKDKIESNIKQLLSQSSTLTFKSIELTKGIAETAEKYVKTIARRSRCAITTKTKYKSQYYIIPKASLSTMEASKSTMKQSDDFLSSLDVFSRIIVANGSIEVHTGDIALQNVDTIVISTTFNGLKEGVIERAGEFEYENTYTDASDIKFTQTNGGTLNCKQILFSTWAPLINDDQELRKSIDMFVSKSIGYAIKDRNSTSIAFAISDAQTNERVLVEEMIATAKKQLESKKLHLNISFILLPEQQTLHNQFFTQLGAMQDIYAQVDFPAAIIKITLMSSDSEILTKCQNRINNYLKRCITYEKLEDSKSIFHQWDQDSINAFYKYCKDRYVIPKIHQTKKELELTGPINNALEVKQKWYILSDLTREKTSRIPNTGRPRTARSAEQTKVYNIMIGYCQQDKRKCQYLINRFTEEGFSIWAEPVITGYQRNAFAQIDKSDCIVLCISEDYYENEICEKEARYAFQTGKQVFLVKIQNDPLIGWQRRVFVGKYFFQLFGSENHFDSEFGKLLIEILRYTKPGYASLLKQLSTGPQIDENIPRRLLTIEQRRLMYDEKIRTLTQIGLIKEKDMKKLIKQVQNVISDINGDNSESDKRNEKPYEEYQITQKAIEEDNWMTRWLRKPTNITKQNLPPFSATGDINDALFPMPEYILNSLNLNVQSFSSTQTALIKFGNIFEYNIIPRVIELPFTRVPFNPIPADAELIYGTSATKLKVLDGLSQVFSDEQPPVGFDQQKRIDLPIVSPKNPSISDNKTRKHRQLNGTDKRQEMQKKVTKRPTKKYERPTRKILDIHLKKFAEQMNKAAIEFAQFCSKTATLNSKLGRNGQ